MTSVSHEVYFKTPIEYLMVFKNLK